MDKDKKPYRHSSTFYRKCKYKLNSNDKNGSSQELSQNIPFPPLQDEIKIKWNEMKNVYLTTHKYTEVKRKQLEVGRYNLKVIIMGSKGFHAPTHPP